jgi:hypothetical protein
MLRRWANRRALLASAGFGAAAAFTKLMGLGYTSKGIDFSAVLMTVGACFVGPLGGVVMGLLSVLPDPSTLNRLQNLLSVLVGVALGGSAYKHLVWARLPSHWVPLGAGAVALTLYLAVVVPAQVLAIRLLDGPATSYLDRLVFLRAEVVMAPLVCTLVLALLPKKHRAPLW